MPDAVIARVWPNGHLGASYPASVEFDGAGGTIRFADAGGPGSPRTAAGSTHLLADFLGRFYTLLVGPVVAAGPVVVTARFKVMYRLRHTPPPDIQEPPDWRPDCLIPEDWA